MRRGAECRGGGPHGGFARQRAACLENIISEKSSLRLVLLLLPMLVNPKEQVVVMDEGESPRSVASLLMKAC
jgi:hypothetical protein